MPPVVETRTAGFVGPEKKFRNDPSKALWSIGWMDPPGQESVVFAKAGADAVQSVIGKPHEFKISTNKDGKTTVREVVGIWKEESSDRGGGGGGGGGGSGGSARTAEDRTLEATIAGYTIAARVAIGLAPDEALAFIEGGGARLSRAIIASAGAAAPPAPVGSEPPPAGAPDTKPATVAGNGSATDQQIKALQTIGSKIGWDEVTRHEIAGVKSFHDLTIAQAASLIDTWQDILAEMPVE